MKDCLLIYSGGLDSTAALYAYKGAIKIAVSFNYGSLHNEQELAYARLNCAALGIEHVVIDLRDAFRGMASALLGDEAVPEGHYEDESMKVTVVPFRNAILLSVATGIAESNNITTVMLGSHRGDNAIYPDCRPEFNKAMAEAMKHGTYGAVKLVAPFQDIDKREIASIGVEAGMDPELTYSCYKGGAQHCGVCSTCRERDWALGLREEA